MNDHEKANLLANLFCFMQGANPAFAKEILGTWSYKDGLVVHNLAAQECGNYLGLFRNKLAENNIAFKASSICECKQCLAIIVGSRKDAKVVRDLVFQTAFEITGLPSVPPNPVEHGIMPPDFPTIDEHVDFIKQLQTHGLLRCSHTIMEGQSRTQSK